MSELTIQIKSEPLPRDIKIAVWGFSISWFFWGPIDAFWGLYLESFGSSYAQIGWLMVAMKSLSIFLAIPMGILADRISSRKIILAISVLIIPIMFAYYYAGATKSVGVLIVALLTWGMARMIRNISMYTYIKEQTPVEQSVQSWTFFKSLSIGLWAVGLFAGAGLIYFFEVHELFLLVIIGVLIRIWSFYRVRDPKLSFKQEYPDIHGLSFGKRLLHGWQNLHLIDTRVWYMMIATFIFGIVVKNFEVFIVLFAEHVGMSLPHIAFLGGLGSGAFLLGIPLYRYTKRMGKFSALIIGQIMSIVVVVAMAMVTRETWWWLFILVFMHGLAGVLITPVRDGIMAAYTPQNMQGEISGIQLAVVALGSIVGSLLFGYSSDAFGIESIFVISAILYVFLLAGFIAWGLHYQKGLRDLVLHPHLPHIHMPHLPIMHRTHLGKGLEKQ